MIHLGGLQKKTDDKRDLKLGFLLVLPRLEDLPEKVINDPLEILNLAKRPTISPG